jgi:hypothetical protein
MNSTVQNHLASRRLEPFAAEDQELSGFWRKALIAHADAHNASTSPENRLLRAYDAGRLVALMIVQAFGYRTRGGDGHHFVTFEVARSLSSDPELRRALDAMNSLRKFRHAIEYEADDDVDEPIVTEACRLAGQILELGALLLRERRPQLVLPERD